MELTELKAKAEKYYLMKYAGKYYIDETSQIVKKLNSQGEKALLGIKNPKGVYTVIGLKYVHYLTPSGSMGKILLKKFTNELHENVCNTGFTYLKRKFLFKNIVLSNNDKVWLHNSSTMYALWDTILWLAKEERRRIFREKSKT